MKKNKTKPASKALEILQMAADEGIEVRDEMVRVLNFRVARIVLVDTLIEHHGSINAALALIPAHMREDARSIFFDAFPDPRLSTLTVIGSILPNDATLAFHMEHPDPEQSYELPLWSSPAGSVRHITTSSGDSY